MAPPAPGVPASGPPYGGPSGPPFGSEAPPNAPSSGYPANAPSSGYPGNAPSGGGPGDAPPTGRVPGAAFPGSPADGPPTSTTYGTSQRYGDNPHFSDLVTHPGDAPPPDVVLGPLPGSDEPAGQPRKSRKSLVVSLVIVAVVFLLAVAGTGVVVALNNAGDGTYAVNSCVKRDGDKAVEASCSESGAFTVVSKQDKQEDCPDPNQPFVVLEHKGSNDQVLCLRPANQK